MDNLRIENFSALLRSFHTYNKKPRAARSRAPLPTFTPRGAEPVNIVMAPVVVFDGRGTPVPVEMRRVVETPPAGKVVAKGATAGLVDDERITAAGEEDPPAAPPAGADEVIGLVPLVGTLLVRTLPVGTVLGRVVPDEMTDEVGRVLLLPEGMLAEETENDDDVVMGPRLALQAAD